MFIEDIMNDFDNISADFFDSKVSEEETLNALENLLTECQNSFDEYSEKYHLWYAKRWREIIEEMAAAIEVNKYEQEYGEELEEKKDKALALFGKYFFHLWF